ncbi:MAG: NtaA/DmoA family FMN-dependent monooxygenase [Micrococcus sp.]|nr:NtaA/DmoA family FMN-dependent monooxygenase [Micrococcus sp.]
MTHPPGAFGHDRDRRPRLIVNAFLMNTASHIMGGQWRRPEAEQHRFNELSLWTDLARRLEEARFDALFFADVVGLYGDYDGGWDGHVRRGLQVPSNDPVVLLSALAGATSEIGLAATSSIIQSHPFQFARQLSTLDHLSGGRAGWNIVTSVLENAHRNFGAAELARHDERYDWAEEYLEAVYKLWEGSWDEGAFLADKQRGMLADPGGVHKIHHRGERYSIEGPHLSAPSPQRTPVLFQAGASPRGQQFCARHAEATFTLLPHPKAAAEYTARVRKLSVLQGRRGRDLAFIQGFHVVTGSTEEEVARRLADVDSTLDIEALLAHTGGGLGIDFGGRDPDEPLADLVTEGGRGQLEAVRRFAGTQTPTVRDFALFRTRANLLAGTPEQIADALQEWQDAGIDGINLINHTIPGSYAEFIEAVLPELQRRGLAQTEYAPGTLRQKLFGRGDRLPERHPAAHYRGAFRDHSAVATRRPRSAAAATVGP